MTSPSAKQNPWEAEGNEKRQAVQRIFSDIARNYDRLNGLLSFNMHRRWRAIAVSSLKLNPGDKAVDICCGTGDFAVELLRAAGKDGLVLGIDFAKPMLEVAARKTNSPYALGDACALAVQDGLFDAATVGWGIRNVPDIDQAHREIARILKKGGRFVSLDMAVPEKGPIRFVSRLVFRICSPLLGTLFGSKSAYQYLPESTERFWSREQLAESMRKAGLTQVRTRDFMFGNICMHWGIKE
jgi:demethylmenaquinone methyltransferase/2-methoxy-6-polyprenyl-1,4-benzoquinol methylase